MACRLASVAESVMRRAGSVTGKMDADSIVDHVNGGEPLVRVTVSPEQIRTAFEAVKDDSSFDESRGLWERGQPPVEMIQAMCLRPEILRAFAGFGDAVYPGGLLERRIKEFVIITSSQRNECQFCESAHCDIVDIEDIIDDPLRHIADP